MVRCMKVIGKMARRKEMALLLNFLYPLNLFIKNQIYKYGSSAIYEGEWKNGQREGYRVIFYFFFKADILYIKF